MFPTAADSDWYTNDGPADTATAWVRLNNGIIQPAIRRRVERNGDWRWAWFDLQGFVIGWASRVTGWKLRAILASPEL